MDSVPGGERKEGQRRFGTSCEAVLPSFPKCREERKEDWVQLGALSPALSGIFRPGSSPHLFHPVPQALAGEVKCREWAREGRVFQTPPHLCPVNASVQAALNRTWAFLEAALPWVLGSSSSCPSCGA